MPYQDHFEELDGLVDDLWAHPELGYAEHYTSARVAEFVQRHGSDRATVTPFAITGLRVDLPPVAGPKRHRVAVVAELDAVISPAHPDADPATGAVHACGHHTQVAIALAVFAELMAADQLPDFGYDLSFVFVPAEEFVDLDHRARLRADGVISWFGGKPEAMQLGVFDDIDAAICLHAIGEEFERPTVEINCDLAGFLYKYVTFHGRASHAGFDPFSGNNAYSMATLFTTALGLARQQLREDACVRMNPVIGQTSMTTNVVPHEVRVGTDLRSIDLDYLHEVAGRIDQAAEGSAHALGGSAEIRTEMGYLPFFQDRQINRAFAEAFEVTDEITDLIDDRGAIAAAGDAGDLSYLIPTVQLSYGGFAGTIHGRDFRLVDRQTVLVSVPKLLHAALERLADHLPAEPRRRSFAQYRELIASFTGESSQRVVS
ncbi:MAG TPA: M20/M25/M40 family metallo-hydrolase [Microlunatus sp.]